MALLDGPHKQRLHHYYESRDDPTSPGVPFLLMVSGAVLLLTLFALVPHIRAGANSSTSVYYDSYQGKDVVVRNDDQQLALLVLALGCMTVLLGGTLCYFASVVLDDGEDDDEGGGNGKTRKGLAVEGDGIVLSSIPSKPKHTPMVDKKNSDNLALPK